MGTAASNQRGPKAPLLRWATTPAGWPYETLPTSRDTCFSANAGPSGGTNSAARTVSKSYRASVSRSSSVPVLPLVHGGSIVSGERQHPPECTLRGLQRRGSALAPPQLETVHAVGEGATPDDRLVFAFRLSWVVNWLLLAAKVLAYIVSSSKAVLASLADSVVDLVSQFVIWIADILMKRNHPLFPVGRNRLEAVGVIGCASIMVLSAVEVVQFAGLDLYGGLFQGRIPTLDLGPVMYGVLAAATGLKLMCFGYSSALRAQSDAMAALAEDHLNDVVSNLCAIATATVAAEWQRWWWADPVGAIFISLFIVWRWSIIVLEQVDKIVGKCAPDEFIHQVRASAAGFSDQMTVSEVLAYHFGSRFNVEMDVVMPPDMTVQESHDIAFKLQNKVEELEQVERAFVAVDYMHRKEPTHKVGRSLSGPVPRP